jgi:hypothetical protein
MEKGGELRQPARHTKFVHGLVFDLAYSLAGNA